MEVSSFNAMYIKEAQFELTLDQVSHLLHNVSPVIYTIYTQSMSLSSPKQRKQEGTVITMRESSTTAEHTCTLYKLVQQQTGRTKPYLV